MNSKPKNEYKNFTNEKPELLDTDMQIQLDNMLYDNKQFDNVLFNKQFEQRAQKEKEKNKKLEEIRLKNMIVVEKPKQIYEYNLYEILIGMKNTIFDIFDDIIHMRFNNDILSKNNRLFFLGVTLVFVTVIVYVVSALLKSDKPIVPINTVHHIYHFSKSD